MAGRRRFSRAFEILEGEVGPFEGRSLAGIGLPAPHDYVAIFGLILDAPRLTTGLFSGDKRAAAAGKWVEHDRAALGDVPDRVRQHGHGLDGRMHRQFVKASGSEGVTPAYSQTLVR